VAQDADWVAFEDGLAEALVCSVVAALAGGSTLLLDSLAVFVAATISGRRGGTTRDCTLSTAVGHSRPKSIAQVRSGVVGYG
jgi:hypothetical protein